MANLLIYFLYMLSHTPFYYHSMKTILVGLLAWFEKYLTSPLFQVILENIVSSTYKYRVVL